MLGKYVCTFGDTRHISNPREVAELSDFIKRKWKRLSLSEAKQIIVTANTLSDKKSFPRKEDILAIVAIESSFNKHAVSSANARGLMQVLYKPTTHDIHHNMVDGVCLLKDYFRILKSEKAAITAYNVGIGNYLQGMRNDEYYNKYVMAKRLFDRKTRKA